MNKLSLSEILKEKTDNIDFKNQISIINNTLTNLNPIPYTVSVTAPSNTKLFWIEKDTSIMRYYDGSIWKPVITVYLDI